MLRFFYAIAALIFGLSTPSALAAKVDEPYLKRNVQIRATVPWTDTGIDVPTDRYIYIIAFGFVTWAANAYTSPNGVGYYLNKQELILPGATPYSLICKIGSGQPFYVGEFMSGMVTVTSPGRLYCGMNEANGSYTNYNDNSGAWSVTILYPKK